jgi:hypothetical protein
MAARSSKQLLHSLLRFAVYQCLWCCIDVSV